MEGVVIGQRRDGAPEVVVLGFVPADERRIAFNLAFGTTLTVTGVAESVGSRAYSTGLYFASKARQILGEARRQRLEDFRRSVDPDRRFSPGKGIDPRLVARLIGIASPFTPLLRLMTNRLKPHR
jgi:hypothetical protein